MNLETISLNGLRTLLAATPPNLTDKIRSIKAEIERRESAMRWKLANEKALTILN